MNHAHMSVSDLVGLLRREDTTRQGRTLISFNDSSEPGGPTFITPSHFRPASVSSLRHADFGESRLTNDGVPTHSRTWRQSERSMVGRKRYPARTPAVPAEEWEHIRDFVEPIVRKVLASRGYAEGDVTRAVARLAYYCRKAAIPLTPDVVFHNDTIRAWVLHDLKKLNPHTQANYQAIVVRARTELAAPADKVHPLKSIPTPDAEPPYSDAEIAQLASWTLGQSTAYSRHNAVTLLALGFGAGLRAHEMLGVRGDDITTYDDGSATVAVTVGRWPRTVPVLAWWEKELAGLQAEVDHGAYLFRPDRTVERPNSIHVFLRDARPSQVTLSTNRMRATWLVGHLNAGVPLAAILQAAGLDSVSSLARYQKYLTPVTAEDLRDALRARAREYRENHREAHNTYHRERQRRIRAERRAAQDGGESK